MFYVQMFYTYFQMKRQFEKLKQTPKSHHRKPVGREDLNSGLFPEACASLTRMRKEENPNSTMGLRVGCLYIKTGFKPFTLLVPHEV